jgi:dTMP kinase
MAKKKARRGRLIVLDGPDGAGKSTQIALLAERLRASGLTVQLLREPGGTAAGEEIRKLVLEQRGHELSPRAETFLFQAARAQLIEQLVRPALARGEWVLCDRFTLSTLVYQGLAGKVGRAPVEALSALATGGLKPDRYFVVWVPLNTGVARRSNRADDRMEAKGEKFLRVVSNAFRAEARRAPKLYRLIDGGAPVGAVQEAIWKHVEPLLP